MFGQASLRRAAALAPRGLQLARAIHVQPAAVARSLASPFGSSLQHAPRLLPNHARLFLRPKTRETGPVHTHKVDPEAHPMESHDPFALVKPPAPNPPDRPWIIGSIEQYNKMQEESAKDPAKFWGKLADELIDWFEPYKRVFNDDNAPFYKWFEGGKCNVSQLMLDRNIKRGFGDRVAVHFEGEPGDTRTLTFKDLHAEVCRFAGVLRHKFGVKKGEAVVIYMPMVPETIIAMLACARIGAVHCVVFGGFSDEALRDRISDVGARVVVTADGSFRRGKPVILKPTVDKALEHEDGAPSTACVKHVVVVKRANVSVPMQAGRDVEWGALAADKAIAPVTVPEPVEANDPLFIMHTSGSTGKPKGAQHSTAGYALWAQASFRWVFDLDAKRGDTLFSTGDLGWIMGHTSMYGPLLLGCTTVQYEGFITTPDPNRLFRMIEKYKVNVFFTAPTAVRLLAREAPDGPSKHNMSSIRVLGSAGEPIGPTAWQWYYQQMGSSKAPVVDNWWQTETAGPTLSGLPGATPLKPGSATFGVPGVHVAVVDHHGKQLGPNEQGLLVITHPIPSMLRTLYNDPGRFRKSYFDTVVFQGKPVYFSGDGAYLDKDGYIWITGRVDDVINVAGHRLGTAEVEAAINHCELVAECAVVARPDPIKGEAIVAFVVLKPDAAGKPDKEVAHSVNKQIEHWIGKIAHLDAMIIVPGLPKTRSGKLMRRILRSVARGEKVTQDTSTLEDPETVRAIIEAAKSHPILAPR